MLINFGSALMELIQLTFLKVCILLFCLISRWLGSSLLPLTKPVWADSIPVPITPDYGGQAVRYADGVIDLRFNRYIAVREGLLPFALVHMVL